MSLRVTDMAGRAAARHHCAIVFMGAIKGVTYKGQVVNVKHSDPAR